MSKSKDKTDEDFERKSYFDTKIIVEIRAMFRFRTKMFPCNENFPSDPVMGQAGIMTST